jgi:hypothetical protein
VSTPEDRQLAGRQIFLKIVQDNVRVAYTDTRGQLEPTLAPDEGIAAELPDGTRVGTVKRSKTRKTGAVTDPAAFLAWVLVNRPDEIVQSVGETFTKWAVDQAKKYGEAVDPTTGEIIPGVEQVTGSPSYLPQPSEDAAQIIRARLAELLGAGLLELPETG